MARQSAQGEAKDAAVNFRTSRRLREVLEQAAKAGNRSLAQEIEDRLLKSMELKETPDEGWDRPTKAYARIVGQCLHHITTLAGTSFTESPSAREAARATVAEIFASLDEIASKRSEDRPNEQELKYLTDAGVAVAKLLTFRTDRGEPE